MCRLADEIIHVLKSNGSDCHRQIRYGLEFICTSAAESGADKCILPLESKARDTEEAIRESRGSSRDDKGGLTGRRRIPSDHH